MVLSVVGRMNSIVLKGITDALPGDVEIVRATNEPNGWVKYTHRVITLALIKSYYAISSVLPLLN